MPLTPESVADHIAGILPRLDKGNFEQIATDLQDYVVMRHWLKRMHMELAGGLTIRKNLMQTTANVARFTSPDSTDQVGIPNLLSYITVPWRHAQTSWAYNYQADILMNTGEHQIVDLVQMRRTGAKIDMAAILEAKAWSLLTTDNDLDPYGIPNWIVYTATAAPGGFTGGFASGWTNIAGLTDLTNFRNYSSTYVTVSKTDLLPSMRQAHEQTRWMSPTTKSEQESVNQENRRYYTDSTTCRAFETLGEAQNENLGRDLAPFISGTRDPDVGRDEGGYLTFRRHPIVFTPQLNDTAVFPTSIATNPIYQIDHGVFKTYCLKGDYMRETGPEKVPDQHNNFRTHVELTLAHMCFNRRRQAIFSK